MATAFSKLMAKPVAYNAVTPDAYRGLEFPGAEDPGNMFQFKHNFETAFRAARDVEATRKLNPDLMNFEQWLQVNRAAFVNG